MTDILVDNAIIYTNDDHRRVIWQGAVAIEDGLIVKVGQRESVRKDYPSADRIIEGRGKLLLPGFVDAHTHLDAAYLRGLISPAWMGWLKTYFSWYFDLLDEQSYYYSALLCCAQRLLTGTTSIMDCGPLPGYEEVLVRAVKQVGIRANLNRVTMDRHDDALGADGFAARLKESTQDALARGEDFIRRYDESPDGMVKAGLCLMQVPTTSRELGKGARQLSDEHNACLHTHAGVHGELLERTQKLYGLRDIEYLNDIGLATPRLSAAHMGWLSQHELDLVKEKGVTVVHCPTSTTINGKAIISRGFFPEMASMGINIALGTDELDISDMVRVMFAVLAHRDARMDATLFPLEQVLRMATVNGAKGLLRQGRLGMIREGFRGDLTLFDVRSPAWVPLYGYSLLPNLVTSASGSTADTVIIDGKIVVEHGHIKTIRLHRVMKEVQWRAQKFAEKAAERGLHSPEGAATTTIFP